MMPTQTIPGPSVNRPQQVHEHAWMVESAHNTSEGQVLYLRCGTGCGARRIDLQDRFETPMQAVSKEVRSKRERSGSLGC